MSLLLLFNQHGQGAGVGIIVEAVHALDSCTAILVSVPCPCEPVAGPGGGGNQVINGSGSTTNPIFFGPGVAVNPSVPGGGPCTC